MLDIKLVWSSHTQILTFTHPHHYTQYTQNWGRNIEGQKRLYNRETMTVLIMKYSKYLNNSFISMQLK